MNKHYPIDKSKIPLKPAEAVTYCPSCGAPVAVTPGAMIAHEERIHSQTQFRPILDTVRVPR